MTKEFECDSCGFPLSKSGYYTAKKRGYCRQCKDNTKAGIQERKVSIPIPSLDESGSTSPPTPPPIQENEEPIEDDSSPDWLNFEFDEDSTTEHIPTALKMAVAMKGGNTQISHETNLEVLKLGLTGVDVLITKYGQAITLDEEYLCKHSDNDKELVAHAQYRWMLEKGIDPSSIIGTGTLAGILTGWYIVPPVLKVRKRSKVKLFKNVGKGFFSRIPIINRFFKKKKQPILEEADV